MGAKAVPVLIDSSAWIDAFRGKTPWIGKSVKKLLDDDLAVTCGPVIFEIRRGLMVSERKKVLPLFEALHRLPFLESDWEKAAQLDADLRKAGKTLPAMDILIAVLCLRHKVAILTLDDHFRAVPNLWLVKERFLEEMK